MTPESQFVIEAAAPAVPIIYDSRCKIHLYFNQKISDSPYVLVNDIQRVLSLREFSMFNKYFKGNIECIDEKEFIHPIDYFEFLKSIDEAK